MWERLARGERVQVGAAPSFDLEKLAAAVRTLRACRSLEGLELLIARAQKALADGARDHPERFVNRFLREAQRLALPEGADTYVMGPAEWLERGLEEIRKAAESGPAHYQLGLPRLTQAVLPERGHLIILAGETGKGKTALALNLAVNLGVRQKVPTLYVNTEMSWRELAFRIYALLGAGSLADLRLGRADPERAAYAKTSAGAGAVLWITDALPWGEIGEVLSLAAAYRRIAGIEVLVVDYIQRLEDRSADMEQWEVFLRAARNLKSLAQQQEMLVVMVAQLNDRGQLAGSRGMAREADAFLVLEEAPDAEGSETHYVVVRKSRHTPAGRRIPVVFDEQTLFVAEVEEADG
ncbi:MAG: DnaB-like helicase C-terminal domain-containing protein [Moorellales bacterium]